jgi:hypothetical protein
MYVSLRLQMVGRDTGPSTKAASVVVNTRTAEQALTRPRCSFLYDGATGPANLRQALSTFATECI